MLIDGATFLSYYGIVGLSTDLSFVLEIAAYDISSLCELCYIQAKSDVLVNNLVEVLFDMMDSAMQALERSGRIAHDDQKQLEMSLEPIGRTLVKLATLFHANGDMTRMKEVISELSARFKYNGGEMLW